MSLIHDALRGQSHAATPAPATPRVRAPRHVAWLAVGVVLAGPLGFLAARTGQPSAAAANAPAPAPASVVMPAAAVITFPPPAAPANAAPANPPLPAIVLASVPAVAPLAAATATAAIPGHVPSPVAAAPSSAPPAAAAAPALKISLTQTAGAKPSTVTAPADEPDPAQVRALMARLQAAVADGDATARDQALAELQATLPANSLTLLRAQAWAAHGSGDIAEAERYYRAILQRMPDDEHAGVNLALLDARRGDVDQARERLTRLAARNTRSPMVSRALNELETRQQ